jgi:predicted unusual protein kinase regulating ubiquinone biosynthesis (AarF/ABC1/UbiB family)
MHSRRFPSGLSLSLLVVGFISGKGCTFQQVKAFSLQKSMSITSKASLLFMDQAADGVDNMRVGDGMERPIVRAIEIASIVSGKLLSPLVLSLLNNGFPSDWGMFWSRSNGHLTNGQRVALALEELGPTYVKFGQALASRPDVIPQSLAYDLSSLQDNMRPFDTLVAGIRLLVERDAALLRTLAIWAESIPPLPTLGKTRGGRLIATELVDAVEEFMSRIIEELDYRNEALNVAAFASLYCRRIGTKPMCVVPDVLTKLCTDNVLVLEWVQGTKLTAVDSDGEGALAENAASLEIIRSGIFCTLSQLLETGVLHADPHGGVQCYQ